MELGSVTSLTDSAGAVSQTYVFSAFGGLSAFTGAVTNSFQFSAREVDQEDRLVYLRARYQDPSSGRFLNEDPTEFGGGINFYAYVENEPIGFTDPSGLKPIHCRRYGSCYGPDNPQPKCSVFQGCFKYHGRYCGPYWTGGWVSTYNPGSSYDPPIDPLDRACRTHDICYYLCRRDHPCDANGRGTCMTTCDRHLAEDAAASGHGMSSPLWWWMQYNNSPDAGPNSDSCPTCNRRK